MFKRSQFGIEDCMSRVKGAYGGVADGSSFGPGIKSEYEVARVSSME